MTIRGLAAALCVIGILAGLGLMLRSCGSGADDPETQVAHITPLATPEPPVGGTHPLLADEEFPPLFIDSPPPPDMIELGPDEEPGPTPTPESTPQATRSPTPSPTPGSETTPPLTATPSPTPLYTLRLLVLGDENQPVSGAEVTIVWREGESTRRASGRTDSAGAFELSEFPAPRVESIDIIAQGYPAVRKSLVTASPETVTVYLKRLPSLRGVVVGGDGAPFTQSFTAAALADPPDAARPSGDMLDLTPRRPSVVAMKTFPAGEGRFEFSRLGPGAYSVIAWTDQNLGGVSPGVSIQENQSPEPLRITLASQLSISGSVSLRASEGLSLPAPGVKITAFNLASLLGQAAFPERFAYTDAQGRYTIEGLAGGLYEVEANAVEPSIEKGIRGGLELRRTASGVDFLLAPKPIRLVGEVRGEDGRPLAAAPVVLIKPDPPTFQRETTTDERGAFEFSGLAAGLYHLGAIAPGDTSRQKMVRLALEGSGVASAPIRFYPRKQIMGRVLRQGAPAGVRSIRFISRQDPQYALVSAVTEVPVSPDTGSYEARLEPGRYDVQAPDAPTQTIVIQEGPDPAYRFDVHLP